MDRGLRDYAHDWANHMATAGALSHSNIGALRPPWQLVAENVA
jgi:hypothetical protein